MFPKKRTFEKQKPSSHGKKKGGVFITLWDQKKMITPGVEGEEILGSKKESNGTWNNKIRIRSGVEDGRYLSYELVR